MIEEILTDLRQALINGDKEKTRTMCEKALAAHIEPLVIIQEGGTKAMGIVGDRFQTGDAFLPDLIKAGRAMQVCLNVVLPHMQGDQSQSFKKAGVVLGTVNGDVHDIGKNIVRAMLTVDGFEVTDLGVDTPAKEFIMKAQEVGARIIGCSSLLTTSMYYQRDLIRYLKDSGARKKFYVIVGGGSVTPEWAREIGADGWARTAAGAPTLCRQLIENSALPPLAEPIIIDR